MLKSFKLTTQLLFRAPRQRVKQWLRYHAVQRRNPGAYLFYPLSLIYGDADAIQIGEDSTVGAFSEIVVLAPSSFSSVAGRLVVGDRVVIGSHANIRAAGGEISIGNNALIAQHVSLIASGHTLSQAQPYRDLPWDESKTGVVIDANVWLGANVTVLPGCCIGHNAVVGAGSVVTKNIPPNELWVGTPAKKMKDLGDRADRQLAREVLSS